MSSSHDTPAGPTPEPSPGRRNALLALAGLGAAGMAIVGRNHTSGGAATTATSGPAGPGSWSVEAAKKKKKGKRGPTGPTGPTGPGGGTLSQNEAANDIPENSNASAQADCLSGQATGGGASISNTACELVSSNVVGTSAWGATGKCPGGVTATITVRVICLE